MPTSPSKPRIHRAWWMLIACIFYQGGSTGILYNCLGIFYTAICSDLGFRNGDLSLHSTIRTLATALAMPFTIKLLGRYRLKYVLTAEFAVVAVLFGSMGLYSHLVWWYISGALMGLVGSSLFAVPVTLVINNWFKKKNGFAVGISLAASGLFGAVLNPVCSSLITAFGWRRAVFLMAGLAMLLVLPMTFFVMKLTPEEAGCRAYGEDSPEVMREVKKNMPQGTAEYTRPALVFALCVVVGGSITWTNQYYSHLARYAGTIGYDLNVSALVTSCAMIGNIIGKVLMGILADKWNIWRSSWLAMAFVSAGFWILFIAGDGIPVYLFYFAAALLGITMAVGTIVPNLMTLDIYKAGGYQEKYGVVTAAGTLVGAVAFAVIGYTYDFTGSYHLSFFLSLVMAAVFYAASITLFRIVKRETA